MLRRDDAKAHLRLEHDDDNVLVDAYLAAAAERVESFTGQDVIDDDAPASLNLAALQLVGHWFENRETTSPEAVTSLPFGWDDLISPYRLWGF